VAGFSWESDKGNLYTHEHASWLDLQDLTIHSWHRSSVHMQFPVRGLSSISLQIHKWWNAHVSLGMRA